MGAIRASSFYSLSFNDVVKSNYFKVRSRKRNNFTGNPGRKNKNSSAKAAASAVGRRSLLLTPTKEVSD